MALHRSQVFLAVLLSFIGGIFLGSFVNAPKLAIWTAMMICVIVIAVFYRKNSKILNPRVTLGAFLMLFFLFGMARYESVYLRRHVLPEFARASAEILDPTGKHKIKVDVAGYVAQLPIIDGDRQKIILETKYIHIGGKVLETSEKLLVTTALFPRYDYGQSLVLNGELLVPKNYPDSGFDYVAYLANSDIHTLMSFPEIKDFNLHLPFIEKLKIGSLRKIFAVRSAFENSINRSVSEPNAGYINGILLGSRSQIPDDLKDAFARTSTSHILAISGFNITIIAGIFSWLFLRFLKRPTAFWFSVGGIVLFTLLTGAQASVIRAAIMGSILLFAQREGRLYGAKNAIVLTGAVMIFINPTILRYDAGFQLSFLATLGLIYLSPFFQEKFAKLTNFMSFRETLAMTISAQIAVLPLLIFYFNKLSIISLPANILVLPMVPLAMLLGFVTGLLGLIIPALGIFAGYFAWFITSIQIFLIKLFASPSWAALSVNFSWPAMTVSYALLIFAVKKFVYPKKSFKHE